MDNLTQPLPSLPDGPRLRAVPPPGAEAAARAPVAMPPPSPDPFLPSWGRAIGWRADALAGQMLAHIPRLLIEREPGRALLLARTLANTMALRHYLVEQIDLLLEGVRCPHLHRVMRQMRIAGRGWVPTWRRHNAVSALGQCYLVEQEAMALARAKRQVQDQQTAIAVARHGLEAGMSEAGALVFLPCDQHERLLGAMEREIEGLGMLHDHLDRLLAGIEVLCAKARLYDEMCNAVPNHEDILGSRVFRQLMTKLLGQPRSGLAVCKE